MIKYAKKLLILKTVHHDQICSETTHFKKQFIIIKYAQKVLILKTVHHHICSKSTHFKNSSPSSNMLKKYSF